MIAVKVIINVNLKVVVLAEIFKENKAILRK